MTCTVCGKGEFRWVKGANKVVFCNECGLRVNNIDGKIKVPGRPLKAEKVGTDGGSVDKTGA
jgi:hypothetical protein